MIGGWRPSAGSLAPPAAGGIGVWTVMLPGLRSRLLAPGLSAAAYNPFAVVASRPR